MCTDNLPNEKRKIHVGITERGFDGLAKQNLSFPSAIMELVDNALSAAIPDRKAQVQVILGDGPDKSHLQVLIADWGTGMSLEVLENALQVGSLAQGKNRINEHGFGINNALCALTGGKLAWRLATKNSDSHEYLVVDGPFHSEMTVMAYPDIEMAFPDTSFAQPNPSTVISTVVPLAYVQTLQSRRGGRASDKALLRDYLVEHLGVAYRGYLEIDPSTMEPAAKIMATVSNDTVLVPPIPVPMKYEHPQPFSMELGGKLVSVDYYYGMIDADKRDHLIVGQAGSRAARVFYQGNMATQGVDIRLGQRVIATAQLEQIWTTEKGEPVARHPSFNNFTGEVIIKDVPRGVLPTTNNKTGIDATDSDWQNLFARLAEFPPLKDAVGSTEKDLRNKWMRILKAARPNDTVTDESSVWLTGTRIDVLDENAEQAKLDIYEIKTGKAEPLNLYQLRMYWDGLVLEGRQPTSATLLVKNYTADIEAMLAAMNKMPPPLLPDGSPSQPYNFLLAKHSDKCLDISLPRK